MTATSVEVTPGEGLATLQLKMHMGVAASGQRPPGEASPVSEGLSLSVLGWNFRWVEQFYLHHNKKDEI